MPLSPLDILRALKSSVNFTPQLAGDVDPYGEGDADADNLGLPTDPGGMRLPGGDPFYGDSFASQQGRHAAMVGADQDLALAGLRKAADQARLTRGEDARAAAADTSQYGLDRALTQANITNAASDVLSEGEARRGFLPWATQAGERDFGRAQSLADTRYLQPALVRAEGDITSANVNAQGRVNAARAAKEPGDPMDALYEALLKQIGGGAAVPEDLTSVGFGSKNAPVNLAQLAEQMRAMRAARGSGVR